MSNDWAGRRATRESGRGERIALPEARMERRRRLKTRWVRTRLRRSHAPPGLTGGCSASPSVTAARMGFCIVAHDVACIAAPCAEAAAAKMHCRAACFVVYGPNYLEDLSDPSVSGGTQLDICFILMLFEDHLYPFLT